MLIAITIISILILFFLAFVLWFLIRYVKSVTIELKDDMIYHKAKIIGAINTLVKKSDVEVPDVEVMSDEKIIAIEKERLADERRKKDMWR